VTPRPKPGIGKGVLHPKAREGKFHVTRYQPGPALADWVEHYWTVGWDLRGAPPFVQDTLPYPSLHVVLEAGQSELVGVVTGRFRRVLEGQGRVFAAKLLPGGAHPFLGGTIARFNDRRVPLTEAFELTAEEVLALERDVLARADEAAMAGRLEAFLLARPRNVEPEAARARDLVLRIASDPAITTVAELAASETRSPRTLQRHFQRYVGVGPKWVIDRFRLQEAAEALAEGEAVADLAARLGYADQAHFSRAFRELVGEPPAAYASRNR